MISYHEDVLGKSEVLSSLKVIYHRHCVFRVSRPSQYKETVLPAHLAHFDWQAGAAASPRPIGTSPKSLESCPNGEGWRLRLCRMSLPHGNQTIE